MSPIYQIGRTLSFLSRRNIMDKEPNLSKSHTQNSSLPILDTIAFDQETQRESMIEEFYTNKDLFYSIIETSLHAITLSDLQGTILMVNEGAVKMHGGSRKEDLIGKSAFDFIDPPDKEKLMKNMKNILENSGERDVEYMMKDFEGNTFPIKVNCTVIRDKEENPIALLAIGRNISDRKKVERALKESEKLYRTLVETSPDSITMTDLQGHFLMANEGAARMHGFDSREEMIGMSSFDLIVLEDRERALENSKVALESGSLRNEQYRLLRKDGSTFLGELSVSLVKDEAGKPTSIMAIVRDISQRQKIEEALAAEKERLSVTLRSIAEGVITVDREGNILLINEVAEELTGWYYRDAVGKKLDKVLNLKMKNNPVDCTNLINDVIKKGEVVEMFDDLKLIAKDGTERVINRSCAPIRDNGHSIIGVVIIIRDVTEKQKLERELFKSRKLESIGMLAGGIAHDFNNILTGITSNLFKAKMDLDKNSETFVSITEAEKAAFRASRLTNQLLTFAKGGAPIKESQSIREVIEDAVGFSLSGSNVDCDLQLPKDLWPLEIDRGQIDQVINNLIINAVQAMPNGGTITVGGENLTISDLTSEATTTYLPLRAGKYVRISFRDEGVGILQEHLDRIYDPYFTTKENGSGLGLTICYSIIKKHNGLMLVKSREGVGTTFHIYLPASMKKLNGVKKEEDEIIAGSGKVLVMDDEEVVRIAAGQVLKSIGYTVSFAKNGLEAIELYKQAKESGKPYNVLIMDLTIPGAMGGAEAIQRLLEYDPGVRAIVSSGYSNDPVMADYKKHGFRGVVAKPYDIKELHAILQKVIKSKD